MILINILLKNACRNFNAANGHMLDYTIFLFLHVSDSLLVNLFLNFKKKSSTGFVCSVRFEILLERNLMNKN